MFLMKKVYMLCKCFSSIERKAKMDSEMKKMRKKLQKTKPLDFGTDEHVMETKGFNLVDIKNEHQRKS